MKQSVEILMKENQISFHELAKQFKVSKQTITKKINGSLDWTYDEIMILAKLFHIEDPMNFFF